MASAADLTMGISSDDALPLSSGTANYYQGTFGANAPYTTTVTVSGAGTSLTFDDMLYAGDAGNANVTISGGGLLSDYAAFTANQAGSTSNITITGAGSKWSSTYQAYIGYGGTGTVTVSDGGTLHSDGRFVFGMDAGGSGTLNIGAAEGDPAAAAGTVEASYVFLSGNGKLVFNHTSGNYVFAAPITGNGTVYQLAGTTRLTGDDITIFPYEIEGGTLLVDSSIEGTMTVYGGARLGGSGHVGTTTVLSGGTISAGDATAPISVLTLRNLTFDAGSNYEVDADDLGNHDYLHVTGTTHINGGTVKVLASGTGWVTGTSYTILTSDWSLDGAFDGVTSNLAFLTPSLSYGAHDVTLTLWRNDIDFAAIANTPNQRAAAAGAEALGTGNPVFDAVIMTDAATARAGFDNLSGEFFASNRLAGLQAAKLLRGLLFDRAVAAAGVPQFGKIASASADVPVARVGDASFWMEALDQRGMADGDGNSAGFDTTVSGLALGADRKIGNASAIGVALSYDRSDLKLNARRSSGKGDTYSIGAYGGTAFGALGLRALASYGRQSIETARDVTVGAFTDRLTASYDGDVAQAALDAGYRVEAGALGVEPFANAAYVYLKTDGFTEAGGASALTVAGETTGTSYTTLGLRGDCDLGGLTLMGSAGWQHAFGDLSTSADMAFASNASARFRVSGLPVARDALALEAGLGGTLDGAKLGLVYVGDIASDVQDHGLRGSIAFAF